MVLFLNRTGLGRGLLHVSSAHNVFPARARSFKALISLGYAGSEVSYCGRLDVVRWRLSISRNLLQLDGHIWTEPYRDSTEAPQDEKPTPETRGPNQHRPAPAPRASHPAGEVWAVSGLLSRSGSHGGRDPGHLPPGGPGDPLPNPDQRVPAARHPGGLQAGPEQTEPEILL